MNNIKLFMNRRRFLQSAFAFCGSLAVFSFALDLKLKDPLDYLRKIASNSGLANDSFSYLALKVSSELTLDKANELINNKFHELYALVGPVIFSTKPTLKMLVQKDIHDKKYREIKGVLFTDTEISLMLAIAAEKIR